MSLPRRLSRVAALLRYHRPEQFAWRLYRIAQRQLRKRLPDRIVSQPPNQPAAWKQDARSAFGEIAKQRLNLWPGRASHVPGIAAGRYQFLSTTRMLLTGDQSATAAVDWNPDAPRLWRFHLQCHEYLAELAEEEGPDSAYQLLLSWIRDPRHRSPTSDPDAWHPFCISRRLPVWLTLASLHSPPESIEYEFWSSIAAQVQWLRNNCEWDLGGNHLLENLSTLYLADSFLDLGTQHQPWSVEEHLHSQLDIQILESGEHFERAPTYHALMMVCVFQCLEAAKFSQPAQVQSLESIAERMTGFANWIRQPDGRFPLLSDSAHEETPDLDKLIRWGTSTERPLPDPSSKGFADYWKSNTTNGSRVLVDTGPLACDHLPAHGHADLLQLTATLGGKDAIVDTGNFDYEPSDQRQFCRSTSAHNVLQLGQQEQCDIWSSFRMGRRGRLLWKVSGSENQIQWCAAAHNGFTCDVARLVIASSISWTVIDWFSGYKGKTSAYSRLHWHPDWQLSIETDSLRVSAKHSSIDRDNYRIDCLGDSTSATIDDSVYCPDFGTKLPNQVLVNEGTFTSGGWLGYQIWLGEPGLSNPSIDRIGGDLVVREGDDLELRIGLSNGEHSVHTKNHV